MIFALQWREYIYSAMQVIGLWNSDFLLFQHTTLKRVSFSLPADTLQMVNILFGYQLSGIVAVCGLQRNEEQFLFQNLNNETTIT